ncbi:hypothetical protein NHF46_22780 [Arthrobacter alpinus]|nr:hypothetical protein [Arthrobacter alpinus]
MVTVVLALLWTGATAVPLLADPGAFTRWGLPLATAIHNLALSAVIGALAFAVVILPKDLKKHRPHSGRQRTTPPSAQRHPGSPSTRPSPEP